MTAANPTNQEYISAYIKRALESPDALETPNAERSAEHIELLTALYNAHKRGGTESASVAWDSMVRINKALELLRRGPSKLIHADDLGTLPQPVYLLDQYPIYSDGFNILVGPSGVGKSFVALDIAGRVAAHTPTIYIAGEGLGGYHSRWQAWKDFNRFDLQDKKAELYFYVEALQLLEPAELEMFIADIAQHKPGLVIIDTLARSAVGIDENSARDMGQFVHACDYIRTQIGCAVLVVHHTGKNGIIRGSSALYAACDSVMFVQGMDDHIRILNGGADGKNKHRPSAADMTYRIREWNIPEREIYGAVLEKVDIRTLDLNPDLALKESQLILLEFIAAAGDDGTTVKAMTESLTGNGTELSTQSIYRILKQLAEKEYIAKEGVKYLITAGGLAVLQ